MKLSSISMAILASSALVLSTAAFAAPSYKGESFKGEVPCPAPAMLKDGFYVGGQVGYDSYRVRQSVDLGAGATANPVVNPTGFVGGLFLGYGQYMNNWFYLAGEIFGNYSGAETSWSGNIGGTAYSSKFEADNSEYGISLLPGVKLNDTSLGYIRLGWNWARLKASETTTTSTSETNTQSGFNYGLGIETLVYDNWSVRTEYSHTNYNSFSTDFGTKFSPSDNQFMLGLIYHFA